MMMMNIKNIIFKKVNKVSYFTKYKNNDYLSQKYLKFSFVFFIYLKHFLLSVYGEIKLY